MDILSYSVYRLALNRLIITITTTTTTTTTQYHICSSSCHCEVVWGQDGQTHRKKLNHTQNKTQTPPWERRLQKQIDDLRKDI
jgi:hypothetical protein